MIRLDLKKVIDAQVANIRSKIDEERERRKDEDEQRRIIHDKGNSAYLEAKAKEEVRYQQERARIETDRKIDALKKKDEVKYGQRYYADSLPGIR